MKKIYAILFTTLAMLSSQLVNAQAGSVVLTPSSGSPVSYASITSAYAAIPSSPTLTYLIELQSTYAGTDASEVYPITLGDKGITSGSGPKITIRPAAGANGLKIKRPTAAVGDVLDFNGADYTLLDGRPGGVASSTSNYLTVSDTYSGSASNRDIQLLNDANNNTIQYINATAADAVANGNGDRCIVIGTTTLTSGNNNNIIQYCVTTGGARGIQDFGQSDLIPNTGTIIQYNTVSNFGAIGIFAGSSNTNISIKNNTVSMAGYNVLVSSVTTGATAGITGIQQQSLVGGTYNITDNTISLNTTSTTINSVTGIVDIGTGTSNILRNVISSVSEPATQSNYTNYLQGISIATGTGGGVSTWNITGNKVYGLSSTGVVNVRGISFFPITGSTVNLTNNFLSITDANASASVIFGVLVGLTTANNYTSNIYYNSINIGGTGTGTSVTSYGIYRSDNTAGSNYNQKNNIIITSRIASLGFNNNTTGIFAVDYNDYYGSLGTGSTNYSASWDGTNAYANTGLSGYQTAASPQEAHSVFKTVSFISATDLHLSGTSIADASLKGVPIAGITTDIDGDPRSTTKPTFGADEGTAAPITLLSFKGDSKGSSNLLQWSTANETNNKGFELQRSADGVNFSALTFVDSKAVNGNSASVLNYSFSDVKPLMSNGYYRLKQNDYDGKSSLSQVVLIKAAQPVHLVLSSIYPNPVASALNLIVSAPDARTVSISIFDITGKLVAQQQVGTSSGDNKIQMDVQSLKAGSYLIKASSTTDNTQVLKFVKQ
jgi:hypothetical protein